MHPELESLFGRVQKPARYTGGELNSVTKDPEQVRIRFAFCFPDIYEVGMSHLGMKILYGLFNRMEDVWCERVFAPDTDMEALMRETVCRCSAWKAGIPSGTSISSALPFSTK